MLVAELLSCKFNVDFIFMQRIGVSSPYSTKAVVNLFAWTSYPSFFTPPAFISLLLLFFFFFFSSSHLFSNLHSSSYLFIIKLLRLLRFVNFFHNSYRKGLIPDIKRFFFLVISFFDSGSSFLFLVLLVWLCRFNFKLVFRHTVFPLLVRHVLRSYSHDRMYILLLYFLVGAEWSFNGCFGFLNFIHLVWLRFCRKHFMNLSLVLIFFFLKLQKIVLLLVKNNSLFFLFSYLLPCQLFFCHLSFWKILVVADV